MGIISSFRNNVAPDIFKVFKEIVKTVSYNKKNPISIEDYSPNEKNEPTLTTIAGVKVIRASLTKKDDMFSLILPEHSKIIVQAKTISEEPELEAYFLIDDEKWEIKEVVPRPKDLPAVYLCKCVKVK